MCVLLAVGVQKKSIDMAQTIANRIQDLNNMSLDEMDSWVAVRYQDHLDMTNTFKVLECLGNPAIMTDFGIRLYEDDVHLVILVRNSTHKTAEGIIATVIIKSTILERKDFQYRKRRRKKTI